jgi:hypothetical protein
MKASTLEKVGQRKCLFRANAPNPNASRPTASVSPSAGTARISANASTVRIDPKKNPQRVS